MCDDELYNKKSNLERHFLGNMRRLEKNTTTWAQEKSCEKIKNIPRANMSLTTE